MAQSSFPLMISVDWLQLSCKSTNPINDIPPACTHAGGLSFMWSKKPYGNKQYHDVYDVDVLFADGDIMPFATINANPTLESWSACQCSIKLANCMLYQSGERGWYFVLQCFLDLYQIYIMNITRCDIAGDFVYLQNRISGQALVKNIKSCKWWKVGTTKICEYYKMPYQLMSGDDDTFGSYDAKVFYNNDIYEPRTESMTFGTLASDAQVCIYDKSLELVRSEVDVVVGKETIKESAKEYIRDCWKQAGVYDEKRHTWRIEIRLKNSCLFMRDSKDATGRPLSVDDLVDNRLRYTFFSAAERYFTLVDPGVDDVGALTRERLRYLATHKSRLPKVKLFTYDNLTIKMTKKPLHKPCNQHNRAVISRIEKLAYKATTAKEITESENTKEQISDCIKVMWKLCKTQTAARRYLLPTIDQLNILLKDLYNNITKISMSDVAKIENLKSLLTKHLRTESPIFTKHVINTLKETQYQLTNAHQNELHHRADNAYRFEDAVILREAADIVKSVYSTVADQQRKEDEHRIFTNWFEQALRHIVQGGRMTYFIFNRIKWGLSDLSPFSETEKQRYRMEYNSKILLEISHCYSYNDYLVRNNLCPVDDDF